MLLALGAPTAWMLLHGTRGAEIANVFALPVGLLGVALSASGFSLRPHVYGAAELDIEARRLATRIATREAEVLRRLLSDSGHAVPADLRFAQPAAALVRWRTDGDEHEGSLLSVADFYTTLDRGRLVVLGEAGAGKTVLAIRLLLDLVEAALSGSQTGLVPVRLSLPAFPPGDQPVARLDRWMADELASGFGLRPDLASALVEDRRILPVLDGLDEMDGDLPNRAFDVVAALNTSHGPLPRPFVLTCRTDRYWQLGDGTIEDSTVVVAKPLGVDQVIGWLTHRFGDRSQSDGLQRRWRPVVTQLRRRPAGALARTLSSPLGLYLAVTTYKDQQSTPKTLCNLKADEVMKHLLSRFVDAAAAQHKGPRDAKVSAEDATAWLRYFAGRLQRAGAHGGSSVDLHLDRLWLGDGEVARSPMAFRLASAAVNVSLILAPLLIVAGIILVVRGASPATWSALFDTVVPPIAVLAPIALLRSGRRQVAHREFDRTAFNLPYFREFLPMAACTGALAGIAQESVLLGVTVTVAVMAMFLLAGGFVSGGDFARNPTQIVRSGLTFDVTVVVGFGLLVHLCSTVQGVVVEDEPLHFAVLNRSAAFFLGMALGLVTRASSPWPRYLIFVWRASKKGRSPRRLAAFFDWTVRAGLTRMAGTAIQFRHNEFQEWLLSPKL
ncbi:NACHT domain-containing protein [Saccharothrix luteola]|uniref:NACHT domain-containing protein n=1 Tax=Saccharothrix luteola TaxID=2893018 RepID=UPI001E5B51B7|nr:NACHT domain-containing protein [Saccharothrix luteola]MCC8251554.1 NACHT domain-containing protein [Saccharothrix luteola]